MKNLVLCCDGTANEFALDRTNVVKLFYALDHGDPSRQFASYHPGLGTMEPPGALTGFTKAITRLLGQAVGYGLESDVRDAYVFLMNNFEADDRVFLFGFSRGSYTVRVVASLLHMYGLLPPGSEPLVPYAIRMMTTDAKYRFALAGEFKGTFSKICKPWFVGVWDTVSSVGWINNPLTIPYSANNPDIRVGRQAISIDEHRAFFRQNLWHKPPPPAPPAEPQPFGPQDMKQVWFPGVHCDVGGGYPEAESGLSKIALQWMLAEAQATGLLLDRDRTELVLGDRGQGYVKPDPTADAHKSLTAKWWVAEFVPKKHYDARTRITYRRMNLFRRRTIPPGSSIHEAAYKKSDDYEIQLPQDAMRVASLPLRWELADMSD
jgi:uncharacterized protein (DUF2235 family)